VNKTNITIVIIIVVVLLGGVWYYTTSKKQPEKYAGPVEKISLSVANQPIGGLIYVALENGYFRDQGLEINRQDYTSGKLALDSVLKGASDLAVTADTPIMHAALNKEDIYIVATIGGSFKNLAVVARKHNGIKKQSDLKGKTIGVTFGTNGEFFLDTLLVVSGIDGDSVNLVNVKPEDSVNMVVSGKVDAFVAWNPHLVNILDQLGNNGVVFYDDSIYQWTWNLVGKQDFVSSNSAKVERFVQALYLAEEYITENPEESQMLIAKSIHEDTVAVGKVWDVLDFTLTLSQSLILNLEGQSRWAITKGLTDSIETPNYLDYIYFDVLEAVNPSAVTIIKP
jgi:ABC-type nitrate/sulfonate/bicarbonate transport system substrate-binding protein